MNRPYNNNENTTVADEYVPENTAKNCEQIISRYLENNPAVRQQVERGSVQPLHVVREQERRESSASEKTMEIQDFVLEKFKAHPGEHFTAKQFAAELGVSPQTVGYAIRRLMADFLPIDARPGHHGSSTRYRWDG